MTSNYKSCVNIILLLGHGGLSAGPLSETERNKVESMLVMSGGEGYIDFRVGKYKYDAWRLNILIL